MECTGSAKLVPTQAEAQKSDYIDGNLQGVLQVIAREEFRFHTQITQNKWV